MTLVDETSTTRATELLGESNDGAHVVRLDTERLGWRERGHGLLSCSRRGRGGGSLAGIGLSFGDELRRVGGAGGLLGLFKVLGAENGDLDEHELALDDLGVGVSQARPRQGRGPRAACEPARSRRPATQHDAHARQIADLGAAHDERIDVEASRGKGSRNARQHTRLV